MLNVLNQLKTLVHHLRLSDSFHIASNNDNRHTTINININPSTSKTELNQVASLLREAINSEPDGFLATTTDASNDLELIKDYEQSDQDNDARNFIKKELPSRDMSLWLSALILRQQFRAGNIETVERLKREMSVSTRGGNIANLCSADYLESHILPLHTYLVEEKHDQNLFLEIYETVVLEFPFAVFVSHNRSDAEIKTEIIKKVEIVKKYGWKKVSIHGIGIENVKKIKRIVQEVENEKGSEIETSDINSHESGGRIITVSLHLL